MLISQTRRFVCLKLTHAQTSRSMVVSLSLEVTTAPFVFGIGGLGRECIVLKGPSNLVSIIKFVKKIRPLLKDTICCQLICSYKYIQEVTRIGSDIQGVSRIDLHIRRGFDCEKSVPPRENFLFWSLFKRSSSFHLRPSSFLSFCSLQFRYSERYHSFIRRTVRHHVVVAKQQDAEEERMFCWRTCSWGAVDWSWEVWLFEECLHTTASCDSDQS